MSALKWRSIWTPRSSLAALGLVAGLLLCGLAGAQNIRKYDQQFNSLPTRFFFFKDSEIVLLHEHLTDDVWRSPDGGQSWSKAAIPAATAKAIIQHPFSTKQAFAISDGTTHYRTDDAGASWTTVTTPIKPAAANVGTLSFHARQAGYLLFMGNSCTVKPSGCFNTIFYSKDSGVTWAPINTYVSQCFWAASTAPMKVQSDEAIFCTEWPYKTADQRSKITSNLNLAYTDNYFASKRIVPFAGGQTRGVVGFGSVDKFFVAAVKPQMVTDTQRQDLDLYVSVDGYNFVLAQFPLGANLRENAYTVLESSNAGLVLDIDDSSNQGYGKEVGTLYFSNSNGTYFTRSLGNTNRNSFGNVDFEKVQGVEGIVLVNIVSNPDQLASPGTVKELESRISFNDGGSWGFIPPPDTDVDGKPFDCAAGGVAVPNEKCALHLHSISSQTNSGYTFSSKGAPGILIGVGNVGDYLMAYDECNTFVSTDGGIKWRMALRGAHKYELGDMGGLIVAVPDNVNTDTVKYSADFGKTWSDYKLGMTVKAKSLTTDPASTTSRFMLVTSVQFGATFNYHIYQLDFTSYFSRTCDWNANNPTQSADFEIWTARAINYDLECLLGHTQQFFRRKQSSLCRVGRDFTQMAVLKGNCPCERENFECDFNYVISPTDPKQCVPAVAESDKVIPECTAIGSTYMASSGYRKVPGDTCEGGTMLDRPVQRSCQASNIPSTFNVRKSVTTFKYHVAAHYYMANSSVLLLRDVHGSLWRSEDEGGVISLVALPGKGNSGEAFQVIAVRLHDHVASRVFVFNSDNTVYYSADFAKTWNQVVMPVQPNGLGLDLLDFHPTQPDWLLFVGSTPCPNCYSSAFYSSNNGLTWDAPFDTYVNKCVFAQDTNFVNVETDAIFCTAYREKSGSQDSWAGASTTSTGNVMSLFKYKKFGKNNVPRKLADKVVQFYVFENYMAVAVENQRMVDLLISLDGVTLTPARFPPNMDLRKNAFTVLQSTTGSVFLDVFQNTAYGKEYGMLFTSNANGTFYSASIVNTNRNAGGLVDFEKMQSIDGVIMVNQVMNVTELIYSAAKKIVTRISFNDGGTYGRISAPAGTACQAAVGATGPTAGCFLNLHSRTDTPSTGPIYSVKSAPGMMMGVGNVGPYLLDYTEGDTFLTRDAGKTWAKVRDGAHRFEFGDYGSLLVLVDDEVATDHVLYSSDDGGTWQTYTFYDQPVRVAELTIEPSSGSKKFLLLGTVVAQTTSTSGLSTFISGISSALASLMGGSSGGQSSMLEVAVQLDFTGLLQTQCDLREDGTGDMEQWSPSNNSTFKCVLGRQTRYWRRKTGRRCYVGRDLSAKSVVQTCECTAEDFECDVGYFRNFKEECVLMGGRDPLEPAGCAAGTKYMGSSGYRRLSKTTCQGGVNLETQVERVCAGPQATPPPPPPPGTDIPVGGNQNSAAVRVFDSPLDTVLYLINSTSVVARAKNNRVWRSLDSGRGWDQITLINTTTVVLQNPYFPERVYFLSPWKRHMVTKDRGLTFGEFVTPDAANTLGAPILEFHAEEADWMIFTGDDGCATFGDCHTTAYWTKDGGASWTVLTTYVRDCEWGRDSLFKEAQRSLVLCSGYADKSGSMRSKTDPLHLYRSDDLFATQQLLFENIVGFAVSESFMVVAAVGRAYQDMHLHVSVDGKKFAEAVFPPNVQVQRNGYTVLESGTGTIMLDVLANSVPGHQWGSLFISNGNGTFYTASLPNTNRNDAGFVDFEKLVGIEGAAVMNQVVNTNEAAIGADKRVRTVITYNNGGRWTDLSAPVTDVDGNVYPCAATPDKCHLHLHLYTEKAAIRNELSDSGATGMMIGIGNVGESLDTIDRGNVYITRDAGVTWHEAVRGQHLFEYGDHGGIIVLAKAQTPVDSILYSLDFGNTFVPYPLGTSGRIIPERFITEPDSTSLRFLLLGRDEKNRNQAVSVAMDFQAQLKTPCNNNTQSPADSDFELWQQTAGQAEKCVLGHISRYYRRKADRLCAIGDMYAAPPVIMETCQCAAQDFECSPGYLRDEASGECKLMPGYAESNTWGECKNGVSALSGAYRKISKTTCSGGMALDVLQTRRCGSSSTSLILTLVLVPCALALAGAAGFMYMKKRSGGHVRLGDSDEPWFQTGGIKDTLSKYVPTRVTEWFSSFRRPAVVQYAPVSGVEETSDVLMDDYS